VVSVAAADPAQARRLVMEASSRYGSVTQGSLRAFLGEVPVTLDMLKMSVPTVAFGNEHLDNIVKSLAGSSVPGSSRTESGSALAPSTDPAAPPTTKAGDLWVMGTHRLLCGDSTRQEDVQRLMREDRAGLMNTDPPYGVAYANDDRPNPGVSRPRAGKTQIANDDLQDEKLQAFLESAFRPATTSALKVNAAWYLWHAHLTQGFFAAAAAAAANVVLSRQIIWVKPVLLLTRGQYHWKHEPCFFGWVKGNQPPDYGRGGGERDQTTVWEVASITSAEREDFNHSTPKPVGLFEIPIVKHLQAGEIAYEPFAGTGPQFIAAEKHERRCFGIEIDPVNCDTIVRRWEKFTGQKAVLETAV
jgi:DNA modification methylase